MRMFLLPASLAAALLIGHAGEGRATGLQFAGDSQVNIPPPVLFDNIAGNDFTFTGIVRPDGLGSIGRVLFAQKDASNFVSLLFAGNGSLYFYVVHGGTVNSTVSQPLAAGQWSHFAARWNAAGGSVSLIVDGVAASGSGGSSSTGTNAAFTLGARTDGGQRLNGALDELVLWPLALSDARIATLQDDVCIDAAPTLAYDFEVGVPGGDNSGLTTLPDDSGNGVDGTLQGFALTGATSNWIDSPYIGCSVRIFADGFEGTDPPAPALHAWPVAASGDRIDGEPR